MTNCDLPVAVNVHQDEIAKRLGGSAGLLVGLDFDGTLAPIAADPEVPTITSACRQAVSQLADHHQSMVAVISGRALADLRGRIDLDGVAYAGNHGLEFDRGAGRIVHPVAAEHQQELRRLLPPLANRLNGIPGCEIEDKGLTVTIHVRRTPDARIDDVRAVIQSIAETATVPLRLEPGKQVIEIRPDIEWDKGSAMGLFQAETPDSWQALYLGDDVTDEDVFRALHPEGVGILVGERRETAAAYRLPSQAAVAPFLEWLIDEILELPASMSP